MSAIMNEFDREIAIRLAFSMDLPTGEDMPKGLSDQELSSFENRSGIRLPNVFQDWLKVTNGPCIGLGGMVGIDSRRSIQNIEDIYMRHSNWPANGWIPVANDGFGNFYVLLHEVSGLEPVAFIDCNIDPERISYVASSNLWTFLRFYFSGESKDIEDSQWPFDKNEVLMNDPDILKSQLPLPWECDDFQDQ